ncbi:MAG: IclR family transcriptional regulator [Burkholderiaceae bacterium]
MPRVAAVQKISAERGIRVRPVPAVSRSIAILRLLGRSPEPLGVKAIAQSLAMVPSTCLHILRVLVQEQLVRVDTTKRYSLGVGMLALARTAIERNTFAAIAQPALGRLAAQREVTAIGVEVVALDYMVVVALARAQMPFSLHLDVGSRFPALISATGRLVAAYSDRPWSEIEQGFKKLRWQNAPDVKTWRSEVEAVRRKGFSVDRGNYISGVTIVAVPLLDASNRLQHVIVAAGMTSQLDSASCTALAKQMQAEARTLTDSIIGVR